MQTFTENADDGIERGIGTQNQLRVWDSLLEIRIHLQKLLVQSNKLPQNAFFKNVSNAIVLTDGEDSQSKSIVQNSRKSVKRLLDNLVELQIMMAKQYPGCKNVFSKAKISGNGNTYTESMQHSADEEEITSSEDDEEQDLTSIHKSNDDTESENEGEKKEEEIVENEDEFFSVAENCGVSEDTAEAEGNDSDLETMEPSTSKRQKLNDYEKIASENFKSLLPFRNEAIQKWNDKTQVASGKFKGNFSAFQISTLKQIDHILSDKSKLLKRSQVKQSNYVVIGKEKEDDAHDVEVFDDDDFFHQLLRELIEKSGCNSNKPHQLSRHYLDLQKMRNKLKRKVDTKASKGRKIRYDVHPKLVNFMAPYEDVCSITESAKSELCKSVFRNALEWKQPLD